MPKAAPIVGQTGRVGLVVPVVEINRLYKFIDYGYILSPRVDGTSQRLHSAAQKFNIHASREIVERCRPLRPGKIALTIPHHPQVASI